MIVTKAPHIHSSLNSMDSSKTEKISCPLCCNVSSHQAYLVNAWHIVQCNNCRFIYVNPRLEKNELLKIYSSNYFDNKEVGYYHYTENKTLRKKNFEKWVRDALPYTKQTSPFQAMDVGCAAGYCLEVFRELDWASFGIELDKSLAASLRKAGFSIFDTPLVELQTKQQFNFISIFDVLEHLTDLKENMAMLHSLLKEGGIVVLVTPNYQSWQRKFFGKKWFQFKPLEHINYFTRQSISRLAEENGFEVLLSKKSGQFCDIAFLENRLKKYRFRPLLPVFYFLVKILGLKTKHFYVDTASLYVILKKK